MATMTAAKKATKKVTKKVMKKVVKKAMQKSTKANAGSSSSDDADAEVSQNAFLGFPPSDQEGRQLSFCADGVRVRAPLDMLHCTSQIASDIFAVFFNSVLFAVFSFKYMIICRVYLTATSSCF